MKFTLLSATTAAVAFASSKYDGKRLIRLSANHSEWLTDDQVEDLALRDIGFLDDTDSEWTRVFELGVARQAQKSTPHGRLRGSRAVAAEYAKANTSVYAQMQQDMTGYVRPGTTPVVNLISDFINENLNTFLEMLIATYVGLPVSRSVCGYYCSDHFAWNVTGYPSSYPFETELKDKNPYMHSQNDTIATIDFNHMADFTKLSIAYVVELTQDSTTSC
ncbi:hypothetical protein H257_11105 [Aphanomyces astaci]|uniref:Peptidase M28 domain-containing protein n=1 Tax=Aphanomyces astaci TaxID=112090 RepID=W4G388_APHAT|nr:hypothetical protein H257_11105 [Aphanomyces astaci]ETV74140.1 hypothetical protein H257_11105 [Aphanomyces astaci]|eukprot:XP_009836246.1 hypothetical protein H257_11105 [Aphanomyces astaci]